MARNQTTQRQRTAKDPLLVGTFDQTSIRYLTGKLGGTHTPQSGGYAGGAVNHWFKFKIDTAAWIILTKAGGWEKWFNVSAYDINRNPIQGRAIFDDDSITITSDGKVLNPYIGHVMGAQSDLYNNFDHQMQDSKLHGDALNKEKRNSKNTWISTDHWISGFLWHYVQKANRDNFLYDLSYIDGESMQYTRYGEGEYYNWHNDSSIAVHYKPQALGMSGGELSLIHISEPTRPY